MRKIKSVHVISVLLLWSTLSISAQNGESASSNCHSQDELPEIIDSVLERSKSQYKVLLNSLKAAEWPRTWESDRLHTVSAYGWISGFYPGTLAYLYEFSSDVSLWNEVENRLKNMEELQFFTGHHDLGFMMYCSFGNAFRLTRDPYYESILIQSAKSLASRFDPRVGSIKSWDQVKSLDGTRVLEFPVIIDNLMNLELLFFASKATGDPYYGTIAVKHAETTLKNHVRSDFSSYHVVDYDPMTGAVKSKETHQGFSDNSTWSRGQAWGIYGFTTVYRETRDTAFLEVARKMADFFLDHPNLPEDKIPYWDFNVDQPGYSPIWNYDPGKYPRIPRDVSAAAIVASALVELSDFVDAKTAKKYLAAAKEMLTSMSSPTYLAEEGTNGGFILKHASGGVPGNHEVDVPLSYADYYFIEALLRYKNWCSRPKVWHMD